MEARKPTIPRAMLGEWQRVVDLAAEIVEVPASLVMKTDPPDHAVLLSSRGPDNPYSVGQSFVLNSKLYCHAVLTRRDCLVVRDAHAEPAWLDNQDLDHGMSFYVGYPLLWPDGSVFGTICLLDRRDNEKVRLCQQLLEEFRRVIEGDLALLVEVARRQRAERELQAMLDELESRVAARTRDLSRINRTLEQEIDTRRKAEAALIEREQALEEVNAALRVLLSNLETSRREFEEQILAQIRGLVLPHLDKLRGRIGEREPERCYAELIHANLQRITSSFANRLTSELQCLTPTEVEVAQMVIAGQTTKQIASKLSREVSTIDFHRNNIRRKLGLNSRAMSLRRHLLALR